MRYEHWPSEARELARRATDEAYVSGLDAESRVELARLFKQLDAEDGGGKFYDLFPARGKFCREFYPKQMEFFRAGRLYRERGFMGGNRTGKTVTGAYEGTAHLTGEYPDWWEGRVFNEPIDMWAAGKKNETVRDILQKEFFGDVVKDGKNRNRVSGTGMIPNGRILHDTIRFNQGFSGLVDMARVRYRDSRDEYSTIGFKAYERGRGSFEGTARHVVLLDEECPIDVYGECVIRTGTVGGIIMLTWTPLDGLTETVLQFLPDEMRPPDLGSEDEYSEY